MKVKPIVRKCLVDGRRFEVNPKRNHYHHGTIRRPRGSRTCSRRCSRIYLKDREFYLKRRKR